MTARNQPPSGTLRLGPFNSILFGTTQLKKNPLTQINVLMHGFENKSIHVPLPKRYRLQVILKKHCLENIRVYAVVTQNSKVPNAYIAVVYDHLLMALESLRCTGGLHFYIAAPTEEKKWS